MNGRRRSSLPILSIGIWFGIVLIWLGSMQNVNAQCTELSCPAGTAMNRTACACEPCDVGTFASKANTTACQPCPANHVAQTQGSVRCSICRAGHQTSGSNREHCLRCSAGSWGLAPGQGCQLCAAGTFAPYPRSLRCQPCAAGSFAPVAGQGLCLACGVGFYSLAGASECVVCPSGYYCPYDRTVTPIECESNNMCAEGSSGPTSCPLMYQSDSGSSSCSPGPVFWVLVALCPCLLAAILLLSLVFIGLMRRLHIKTPSPPEETRILTRDDIPPPSSGPVYAGL